MQINDLVSFDTLELRNQSLESEPMTAHFERKQTHFLNVRKLNPLTFNNDDLKEPEVMLKPKRNDSSEKLFIV